MLAGRRRQIGSVAAAAIVSLLAFGLPFGAHAQMQSSSNCKKLAVTPALKQTLLNVHVTTQRRFGNMQSISGPTGKVYYGRCSAGYALASFRHNGALDDQPEHFRRSPGHGWRDLGDTGGDVCNTAPKALLKLWGFKKRCQLD